MGFNGKYSFILNNNIEFKGKVLYLFIGLKKMIECDFSTGLNDLRYKQSFITIPFGK